MADRRLQVFHAVAKQMSFTKAAESLFMTQPAVTFQIKQLEEHFNARLFDRGHGKITLTPAGEMVLQFAERILDLSTEMDVRVSEMTDQNRGSLLVGASITVAEFMLPRIFGEFKTKFPDVQPRLIVANSEAIENRLLENSIDVGLIEAPPHFNTIEAVKCAEDELVVVCSPKFPLASFTELTPNQLQGHPYIAREIGSGTREVVDVFLHQHSISPDSLNLVMELGGPSAVIGVVESGLGFSIVSRASAIKSQRLGDLVAIPLTPRLFRPLSIIYPKERFQSRLVTTFVEFVSARMRESASSWN